MMKKEYIKPEFCKYTLCNKFSMFTTMSAHGGGSDTEEPYTGETVETEDDFG